MPSMRGRVGFSQQPIRTTAPHQDRLTLGGFRQSLQQELSDRFDRLLEG
jgi:hypothetical protein